MSTMDNDDQELDYEIATDDVSLKIRELENNLSSISSSEDKKLLIWIGVGFLSIVPYIVIQNVITQILVFIGIPVSILGGIGSAIYQNIKKRRRILIKHGLQCEHCGFVPNSFHASGVLVSKKCLKCQSKLDI